MTDPARITVEGLRVTFPARGQTPPVEALNDLSLSVPDGQLLCVVGPSGCGKTTLLRVLAGLEQASSGSAVVRARDPQRPTVGVVFQHGGAFPWMTVRENVGYGLRLQGVPPPVAQRTVAAWITEAGLERFADAYPAQLSGGMQQRVGLARAFAYDPEVLLMDEPFAALDAQNRLILQDALLRQWEAHARTVLFVTHSIEEALTLGDRIIVMSARPGELIADLAVPFARPRDAAALRSDPRFSSLFSEIWGILRSEVDRARALELA